MFKKLRLICFVLIACLFALTPVYADLIQNPGFEGGIESDGIPFGWELKFYDDSGHNLVSVLDANDGYISANEPTHYLKLFAGTKDEYNIVRETEVNQLMYLSTGDTLSGVFAFDTKTGGTVTEYAYVGFYIQETPKQIFLLTNDAPWTEWSWTVPFSQDPVQYRLRYGVYGVPNYDSSDNSIASAAYFDTTYSAVPEPATMILLMAGVVGVGMVRRKLN